MLTRKEIERIQHKAARGMFLVGDTVKVAQDALAKHDALLEIYHLLGGEGEPEDVVEACKEQLVRIHAKLDRLEDILRGKAMQSVLEEVKNEQARHA